eukprot:500092-Pelagomonas_calceolata.AAC.6
MMCPFGRIAYLDAIPSLQKSRILLRSYYYYAETKGLASWGMLCKLKFFFCMHSSKIFHVPACAFQSSTRLLLMLLMLLTHLLLSACSSLPAMDHSHAPLSLPWICNCESRTLGLRFCLLWLLQGGDEASCRADNAAQGNPRQPAERPLLDGHDRGL